MIWVRGAPADFDTWAYLGADGWSWDDVRPVYERIERREPGGPGTVNLLTSFDPDPIHVSLAEAAQECGIPLNEDYNGASQDGVSFMQYSIENGSATAPPPRTSARLKVARASTCHRGNRAPLAVRGTGASASNGRKTDGSSALGRRGRSVGRDDRVAATTARLRSRPGGPPALARNRRRRRPARSRREPARPPALARDLQRRARGRAAVARPARLPDASFLALAAGAARARHPADPFHGADVRAVDGGARERVHAAGRNGAAGQPRQHAPHRAGGRGSGRARPEYPRVRGRPRELRRGRRLCRRIGAATPFGTGAPSSDTRGRRSQRRAGFATTCARPRSPITTRSGPARWAASEAAVVDPRLRVHGIDGLRVADASVMPTVTTGNTNAPSIMIGERAAEFMLVDA